MTVEKTFGWVDVTDFGVDVGDGVTPDDAAFADALATGRRVIVPRPSGGKYIITAPIDATGGQDLIGSGSLETIIEQQTPTVPIVRAASDRQRISGLRLQYNGTPTAGAVGLEFGNTQFGEYDDLYILNSWIGIATDQSQNVFSVNLTNIRILGFVEAGIELDTSSATGSHLSNVYVANNLAGGSGPSVTANRGVVFRNFTDLTVDQLNVEHSAFANEPISLSNVDTAVLSSVHVEGVRPDRFGSGLFRVFGGRSSVNVFGYTSIFNDLTATARHGLFEVDDGIRLFASGVAARNNTVGAGSFAVVSTATGATGASVEVRDAEVDVALDDDGVTDPTAIKRLNRWRHLDMEPPGGGPLVTLTVDAAGVLYANGVPV